MPNQSSLGKLIITKLAIPGLFIFSNFLTPQYAKAATRTCTWQGDVSANWGDGTLGVDTNWNCGGIQSIPTDGDALVFPSGTLTTTTNNNIAGLDLDNLSFSDGYTIGGNSFSLLYGISILGSSNVTINSDFAMTADQNWEVNSPSLTINGVVSGTGNLAKTGSGGLTVYGTNTYTGTTTISSGYVNLHNEKGLGASSAGTVIGSTTTLNLYISGMTIAEPFTINGSGNVGGGAIRNFPASGTNILSGNILLGSNSQVQAETGNKLIISGAVQGTSEKTLYLYGDIQLDGVNTFNGITYIGSGTTLSTTNTLGGLVEMYGATLNADGLMNNLKVDAGLTSTIKPGGDNYGTVTLGNITSGGNAKFSFDLGSSDSDVIQSTGTVNLNNIELNVVVKDNLNTGDSFVILEKSSPGTLTGTFTGLANDATFISGGTYPKVMKINYIAGNESTEIKLTVLGSFIFPTLPIFPTFPMFPTLTVTPTDTVTPTPTVTVTVITTPTLDPSTTVIATATPTGQVLGASTSVLSDTGAVVPVIILGTAFITSFISLLYIHREKLKNLNFKRK